MHSTIRHLRRLFDRDFTSLTREIELYSNEDNLWLTDKNITNSAGNLALHLVGNSRAFIGATLGNTGYVRDRPAEFSTKNVPRIKLLEAIADTKQMVDKAISNLDADQLESIYPINVFGEQMTTGFFLMHLTTHLAYHLGQINYHRRLLDQ